MQLYALKKDFLMRFFSLVSLSRGLKIYGCGSVWQERFCFHMGIRRALFLLHISLGTAKQRFVLHLLIYQFYSTTLLQRKSKFTLVDIMWGLQSNRIDKKHFGAEQILLSCFILCCEHGISQSNWHFFTSIFCMQVYFHSICHTSIQPWHILLQIQAL